MPSISNVLSENGNLLQAEFAGDDQALHDVLAQLIRNEIPVVSFAPRGSGGRLEEVFMSIMEGRSLEMHSSLPAPQAGLPTLPQGTSPKAQEE